MSYDKLKIDVANPELLLKNKGITNEKKGHIFNYSEGRKEGEEDCTLIEWLPWVRNSN